MPNLKQNLSDHVLSSTLNCPKLAPSSVLLYYQYEKLGYKGRNEMPRARTFIPESISSTVPQVYLKNGLPPLVLQLCNKYTSHGHRLD